MHLDREIVQAVTFTLAVVGAITWVRFYYENRRSIWEIVPVMSVLVHVIIYYASILFISPPELGLTSYGDWSAVIRLQTVIILIALAWQRSGVKWQIGS